MTHPLHQTRFAAVALRIITACAATGTICHPAAAQQGRGGPPEPLRHAMQLDREGKTAAARDIYRAVLDTLSDPAQKADVDRAVAMSYAFDGDCQHTLTYEQRAIDYWKTRERADPQNAFYQEGELADEGARVCVDAGDLNRGEQWYRMGYELGMKEPAPRTHSESLWKFRLAHALARIAARRGDSVMAWHEVAQARQMLDADSAMAAQQERFYPYLVGYVALYTGALGKADSALSAAIALRGNERDPFMHCLLAMTYEREGKAGDAQAMYRKAYELATAHNPPSAFVRRYAGKKLASGGS